MYYTYITQSILLEITINLSYEIDYIGYYL